MEENISQISENSEPSPSSSSVSNNNRVYTTEISGQQDTLCAIPTDQRSSSLNENTNSMESSPISQQQQQAQSSQSTRSSANEVTKAVQDLPQNRIRRGNAFDPLKSEYERLLTFMSTVPWPVSFIHPQDCARAGFYFLQEDDKVQCAFCRGVAGEWEPNDDPMEEHRKHFPGCPFICNIPVGNIPMGEEEDMPVDHGPLSNIDVCGPFDASLLTLSIGPDSGRVHGAIPLAGTYDEMTSKLSIKTCRGPRNLDMVTPHSRLKSFTDLKWPHSTGQDPEKMVEAGFFYTGYDDHVKCFYCEGGLRNWEPTDDPWVEHAKWFPRCTFIVLNKGDVFIKEVSQNGQKDPGLPSSGTNSSNEITSSSSQACSSDEEEMETLSVGVDVAGSSRASSSVSSGFCSPTSGNCDVHESSSSGDEAETALSKANKIHSSSKEKALEEEVRKLREAHQCKICMDKDVSVVFLPCGHLVSCTACATAFNKCAFCREPIKAFLKTYMS